MRRRVILEIDTESVGDGETISQAALNELVRDYVAQFIEFDIINDYITGLYRDKKEVVVGVRVSPTSYSHHQERNV